MTKLLIFNLASFPLYSEGLNYFFSCTSAPVLHFTLVIPNQSPGNSPAGIEASTGWVFLIAEVKLCTSKIFLQFLLILLCSIKLILDPDSMLKMPNIRIGKKRDNLKIFKTFLPEVPHSDKQLTPKGNIFKLWLWTSLVNKNHDSNESNKIVTSKVCLHKNIGLI